MDSVKVTKSLKVAVDLGHYQRGTPSDALEVDVPLPPFVSSMQWGCAGRTGHVGHVLDLGNDTGHGPEAPCELKFCSQTETVQVTCSNTSRFGVQILGRHHQ